VTSKTLARRALTQFHLSGHTFEIQRTYGANIYNSDFSAAALCFRHCYPRLRFQSQFFPFNTSHLPILTFIVIIIGPPADQFRSHYIQKSLLGSSLVLSVFRYAAFHYAGKNFTRLAVNTSLPTARLFQHFVQTWRYIPLFIISAPSTSVKRSDYGLDSPGIESPAGIIYFHSRPLTCTPRFFVGQGGRKVLLNIRPFYHQC